MGYPLSTRTVARTVVVGTYVVLLAFTGRPGWLAVLLGLALAAVWAAPFLLASNRRALVRPSVPILPAVEPREAGPTS